MESVLSILWWRRVGGWMDGYRFLVVGELNE